MKPVVLYGSESLTEDNKTEQRESKDKNDKDIFAQSEGLYQRL